MSLRKRVFTYILAVFFLLLFLMGLSSNLMTMKAFRQVEQRFFEQDMARVQTRLDEKLRLIGRYARDWGAWDDMYFFMEDRDPALFDFLLDSRTLGALGLDMVVLLDTQPSPSPVGYGVSDRNEPLPLATFFLDDLAKLTPALRDKALEGPFEEILCLGGELYLTGISPILMTNRTGPARGLLLTGSRLKRQKGGLAASLQTDFELLPPEGGATPDRLSGTVSVKADAEGTALVDQLRNRSLDGVEPLLVRIRAPRTIYNEGIRAVVGSFLWIAVSVAVILLVVMALLNSLVLRRLGSLREVADRIVTLGGFDLRVPLKGDDEITTLSASFNTLLNTLDNLIADIPDALFLAERDCTILHANRAAHAALGLEQRETLKGSSLLDVIKKSADLAPLPVDSAAADGERAHPLCCVENVFEALFLRSDGTERPVEIHRQDILFGRRSLVLLLARDLTERKNFEKRLAKKAYHDDLTGLPNRYAFIERLNRALEETQDGGKAYFAILVNLDRFKLINSQAGHTSGDRMLAIIARRLTDTLGKGLQPYRTGGDEFSFLIPVSSRTELREKAEGLTEKVHQAIGTACQIGDETFFPSASIGVLLDIAPCSSPSEVMSRTLEALIAAKRAGMGFTAYADPQGKTEDLKVNVLLIHAEMHEAIKKEEFLPFYQPIYAVATGKLAGFEALARWNHPVRGFLPPLEFIPVAEQTGFIKEIDLFMIRSTLRNLENLKEQEAPSDLFFSVNGSPTFFQDPYALAALEEMMKDSAVAPSRLVLEVTESLLIEDLSDVSRKFARIKNMGINIALDDFGTGYSSLQYLNELPFDYLKIDRTFVNKLFESARDERLLRTMIDMAKDLRLDPITEGVEREDQLAWLKQAGCSKAQGYLFSRPLPWEEAVKLMEDDRQ